VAAYRDRSASAPAHPQGKPSHGPAQQALSIPERGVW
jgi:hypothetical protein